MLSTKGGTNLDLLHPLLSKPFPKLWTSINLCLKLWQISTTHLCHWRSSQFQSQVESENYKKLSQVYKTAFSSQLLSQVYFMLLLGQLSWYTVPDWKYVQLSLLECYSSTWQNPSGTIKFEERINCPHCWFVSCKNITLLWTPPHTNSATQMSWRSNSSKFSIEMNGRMWSNWGLVIPWVYVVGRVSNCTYTSGEHHWESNWLWARLYLGFWLCKV